MTLEHWDPIFSVNFTAPLDILSHLETHDGIRWLKVVLGRFKVILRSDAQELWRIGHRPNAKIRVTGVSGRRARNNRRPSMIRIRPTALGQNDGASMSTVPSRHSFIRSAFHWTCQGCLRLHEIWIILASRSRVSRRMKCAVITTIMYADTLHMGPNRDLNQLEPQIHFPLLYTRKEFWTDRGTSLPAFQFKVNPARTNKNEPVILSDTWQDL